jgi:integrase
VDLFARTLTIRTSKTSAGERVISLTDVAISALATLRRRAERFGAVEPSHYVFAAFVPKYLPGFRFHDLRHCAITQLAEGGTSDSTIMAIAGHVSRRMLERYSHVRMEAKRTAMEALAVSTRTACYDTNHDTNVIGTSPRPV